MPVHYERKISGLFIPADAVVDLTAELSNEISNEPGAVDIKVEVIGSGRPTLRRVRLAIGQSQAVQLTQGLLACLIKRQRQLHG